MTPDIFVKQYLPCGRKVVFSLVEDVLAEDLAGLLRDALANELIVCLNSGNVTCVAGDHRRLSVRRCLYRSVVNVKD